MTLALMLILLLSLGLILLLLLTPRLVLGRHGGRLVPVRRLLGRISELHVRPVASGRLGLGLKLRLSWTRRGEVRHRMRRNRDDWIALLLELQQLLYLRRCLGVRPVLVLGLLGGLRPLGAVRNLPSYANGL